MSQIPSLDSETYPWNGFLPSPITVNPTRLPVSIYGGATCRAAEFEIPFTTLYSSVIIGTSDTDLDETAFGSIMVVRSLESPLKLNVHAAFTDEARVGNLFCVPYVNPSFYGFPGSGVPTTFLPDQYPVVSGGTNTLIVL
jgi:hypothetical protein